MNFHRRDFLKYSALISAGAVLDPLKVFSFTRSIGNLQLLVLGDSIMWGQGLADDRKFYYLTEKWLEERTKRGVVTRVEAHSGATIVIPKKIEKYPKDRLQAYNQEVNISTPTIDQQVRNAQAYYIGHGIRPDEVELILLNGGLNDIPVANLLNPLIKETWVNSLARDVIGKNMLKLLQDTCLAFPNARIIVTGYYPLVSTDTNANELCVLVRDVLGLTAFGKFVKWLLKLLGIKDKWENVCSSDKVQEKLRELVSELSCQSDAWCRESDIFSQSAVDEVNRTHPVRRPGAAGPRAIFVKAPFTAENAYGASKTFLWRLTPGINLKELLKTDDQLFHVRGEYCNCPLLKLTSFHNQTCRVAGTGHPNLAGSNAYFNAIQTELDRLIGSGGWLGET